MSDLIDRQAVMDTIDKIKYALWEIDIPSPTVPEYIEHHEQVRSVWELVDKKQKELMTLPSAEPKRGKWVNNIHDLPICDQCGYMTPFDRAIDDYEYGNFCPNCGADMRGGNNE